MTEPVVSVLLPVYNAEPWLLESVSSILDQSLRSFELIVVEDGSTDGSREILAEVARRDTRLRWFPNPRNLGLVASLNAGLLHCRGRYVARHDADDVALPTRLQRQVDLMERRTSVGIVGSWYWRLWEDGRRALREQEDRDETLRWWLLFGNIWPHSSILMRRAVLDRVGDPPYRDVDLAEDYDLWLRVTDFGTAATVEEPLMLCRVHETTGLSASSHHRQTRSVAELSRRRILDLLPAEEADVDVDRLRALGTGHLHGSGDLTALPMLLELVRSLTSRYGLGGDAREHILAAWARRAVARNDIGATVRLLLSPAVRRLLPARPELLTIALKNVLRRMLGRRSGGGDADRG